MFGPLRSRPNIQLMPLPHAIDAAKAAKERTVGSQSRSLLTAVVILETG